MEKSKIAKIVSIILRFMFMAGIGSLLFIPKIYNLFAESQGITFETQTILYKIAFYLCALLAIAIVFMLIKIFDEVYKGSPFKKSIENKLKIIAILFMVLSIIVFIKTIFITSLISVIVVLVTFVVSLCFYVLSQVFKIAIKYKNEVDLTV